MSLPYQSLSLEIDAARGLGGINFAMGRLTAALEFDHWHYERASYANFAHPKTIVMGNLPPEWGKRERLQEPTRLSLDNAKRQLKRGFLHPAHVWGAEPVDSQAIPIPNLVLEPKASESDASFKGFEGEYPETSGWSQVTRSSDGITLGLLSLIRQRKQLTAHEIAQKQTHIYWLAHAMHDKITQLQATSFQVTDIEREIMRWTADGKSSSEIACILEMKERTVTFRINNVVARLGVQNKTAAAVRLAVGGLLF